MNEMIPREMFTFPGMRSMIRDFFNDPFFRDGGREMIEEGNLALDVSEGKDGAITVKASMPGYKKEDINISVHNGVLSIRADTSSEEEVKDEKFFRRERRWGTVSRSVALPGDVSEENVKAELKDGILTIKLQPSPKSRPKKIEVK